VRRRGNQSACAQAQKNHASVRLEPEILDRIDALIPQFSTARRPGTRSDAVRALILSGLEHLKDARSVDLLKLDADTKTTRGIR
jgi:hypothetical protein